MPPGSSIFSWYKTERYVRRESKSKAPYKGGPRITTERPIKLKIPGTLVRKLPFRSVLAQGRITDEDALKRLNSSGKIQEFDEDVLKSIASEIWNKSVEDNFFCRICDGEGCRAWIYPKRPGES